MILPDNTTYYNFTTDKFGNPQMTMTYTQIFQSLQNQMISDILIGFIAFLVLSIAVIEITRGMNPATIEEIKNHTATKERVKVKVLRSVAWICFPIALFGVLILISVKMGWNL